MATINFLYRSSKNKSTLTLRLLFRNYGKDKVLGANSNILVEKEFWIKHYNNKKLKEVLLLNEQKRIRNLTNDLTVHILDKLEVLNLETLSKNWLQFEIDNFFNPVDSKIEVPRLLTEYFDYYIDLLITNKNTKKKLITTKNKLSLYENNQKRILSIESINNVELNFFKKYLLNLQYSQNTILVDFSNIKTICRHAKSSLRVNEEIFNWSLKKERNNFIFLNFDEIESIQKLQNLSSYLDNARDWLIISCFTGQRVSDFMRFEKSNLRIEKDGSGKNITFIEFTQKKTNQNIALPLHPKVIKILEKRNMEFPHAISDVNYNKYIKIVAKLAKITQVVDGSKIDKSINRKVKKNYSKNELVTSHIGRRSFATNFYGEIPTPLLMSATGHQTEKTFLNYIGKTQTDRAKSLSKYF